MDQPSLEAGARCLITGRFHFQDDRVVGRSCVVVDPTPRSMFVQPNPFSERLARFDFVLVEGDVGRGWHRAAWLLPIDGFRETESMLDVVVGRGARA